MSPSKGTMPRSLRVPPEVWTAAVAKAAAEGTTVTALVVQFLTEYVSETPASP